MCVSATGLAGGDPRRETMPREEKSGSCDSSSWAPGCVGRGEGNTQMSAQGVAGERKSSSCDSSRWALVCVVGRGA